MDLIQIEEFKELVGNYFIWRAKQLVATVEMEQGRVGQARNRMDTILREMTTYFGNSYHNAMDQHLGQTATICIRQKDYSATEEVLGRVVQLRIQEFGEAYEGILIPLLRIASFQRV